MQLESDTRARLVLVEDELAVSGEGLQFGRFDISAQLRAEFGFMRRVRDIGGTLDLPFALGETFEAPFWSTYPPHKHDTDVPEKESSVSEVLIFSTETASGVGLVLQYEHTVDEAVVKVVRDGSVTFIENGYHSVVSDPRSSVTYVWVGAGCSASNQILFSNDPDFER